GRALFGSRHFSPILAPRRKKRFSFDGPAFTFQTPVTQRVGNRSESSTPSCRLCRIRSSMKPNQRHPGLEQAAPTTTRHPPITLPRGALLLASGFGEISP